MYNEFGPVAQAAIDKTKFDIMPSKLSEDEIMAQAYQLRTEAHAQIGRGLLRAVRRLFTGPSVETKATIKSPVAETPVAEKYIHSVLIVQASMLNMR